MSSDGIARHTPTLNSQSAVRLVIADTALLPDIGGALTELLSEIEWLEVGDSPADIIESMYATVMEYYNMTLIGMVNQFITEVPVGWLALDGSTHAEDDYPELHEALPASMKAGSNFTLPDLTDVFVFGTNTGSEIGDTAGQNTTTLTIAQMPEHSHSYVPPVLNLDLEAPGVPDILAAGVGTATLTGSTGSGDTIENRPSSIKVLFAVYAGRV